MDNNVVKISIVNPCSENWANMSATNKGAFCQQCQKEVIDFSKLSDNQIIQLLGNNTGSICGKVKSDQLNRSLNFTKTLNYSQPSYYKFFVGLFVSSFWNNSATAKSCVVESTKPNTYFTEKQLVDVETNETKRDSSKQIIKGKVLDKETNEAHTKRITRSAENLLENMEELLLWSKGQMEHFKPSKKMTAVSRLFKDIENTFSDNDNVKFIFDNSRQLDIYTDEDYLKTIMRNLTSNSVKTLNNVAGATIEWKAWEENGKQYLSITDNGKGITEQQLKILNEGGHNVGIKSGLGLHLVRDMAKAITCTISVTAAPGKGTSFQLAI